MSLQPQWLWERLRRPAQQSDSVIPLSPNVSLVINKEPWTLPTGSSIDSSSTSSSIDSYDDVSSDNLLKDPTSPQWLYLQLGEGMTLVFKMGPGQKKEERESVPKFLARCFKLPGEWLSHSSAPCSIPGFPQADLALCVGSMMQTASEHCVTQCRSILWVSYGYNAGCSMP